MEHILALKHIFEHFRFSSPATVAYAAEHLRLDHKYIAPGPTVRTGQINFAIHHKVRSFVIKIEHNVESGQFISGKSVKNPQNQPILFKPDIRIK